MEPKPRVRFGPTEEQQPEAVLKRTPSVGGGLMSLSTKVSDLASRNEELENIIATQDKTIQTMIMSLEIACNETKTHASLLIETQLILDQIING